MSRYARRDLLRFGGLTVAAGPFLGGCTAIDAATEPHQPGEPLRVGLLLPAGDAYKPVDDELRRGWELYLKLNDGRLGGREVRVVDADEGVDPKTAVESAKRLIKNKVHVVCGVLSTGSLLAIYQMFADAEIPLISMNASPAAVQGRKYCWRTSFVNDHAAVAIGGYLARTIDGPLSVIVADHTGSDSDHIKGLDKSFTPAGGEYAGDPVLAPFPLARQSLTPFLEQLEAQEPAAVFAYFVGADSVQFIREYKKSGLAGRIQLHCPGWVTEGPVLNAQGEAAFGILNSLNYSADLDNPANRSFVSHFWRAHHALPTSYSMAAYDAGWVLDRAVAAAGRDLSPERLEAEIGKVGQVDSPRGSWEFGENRSPVQKWYLRRVQRDGEVLANVVVDELATLGDEKP